ncbi:uncharacterized protein CTHT_0069050 [Thermochaetoides thermophila DSM 1495]|uniref:D-isomer specific 2-hydroxyacid dehydrogenase NAD-binding domain-containing protein n=1 Tax=Chaetomium thermophilum (strain DSM 1495 / CBS 144.50 / IMI 039719) TaxID=759272 RepID=G0SH81_CHATD|nr:hypothetical protein CTHT_0069050 [Thermochaetoides thermophila DSM 1495]EGS17570.1 hypothetical protein CTHT_0069050 [Thermochaetoides thermophila DSM 1495]
MAKPNNTPVPSELPVSPMTLQSHIASRASPSANGSFERNLALSAASKPKKPIVLHIGDPIKYNPGTYATFSQEFEVIRPSTPERERPEFIRALKERRWGDFSAIFRPFWGTGGEMGKWDAELIDLLPDSVKVFASAGAGFDWADTKLLGEKGIIYCNSGLAAAEAVADFAVTMIISTFRHLPWCMGAATFISSSPHSPAREEVFRACHTHATAASHNPRGHTLGLIGFGNIGQHIAAKMGNPAFGMHIAYHDLERKPAAVEAQLRAVFYPDLPSLLRVSDCVVLCTPASPDNTPLITASMLQHLRPGSRFVNVARGSLVDEEALADALEAGTISAAALDVHADEPRVNNRLVRMATQVYCHDTGHPRPGRVMLTCHNAGGTIETHIGFEELSMRNIMDVLRGGNGITPVNLKHFKPKPVICDDYKNELS